ncbi:MAG: GatB/YqeY domain-containing protein [Alphaproteobacteria bacterium]|nr:MAG: GatB/YqeY domain-containing protein [Alphaproteobacteria bacterium]
MLRDRLQQALKDAMRHKEGRKLATIRLILAAIKDRDIAQRTASNGGMNDDAMISDILVKMVKQRRDSIKAFEEGGRCELAEQEREEIAVIEEFLPRQLSEAEMEAACKAAIDEVGAESLKDMGRTMGTLKARYAGQMDFAKAGAKLRALLG